MALYNTHQSATHADTSLRHACLLAQHCDVGGGRLVAVSETSTPACSKGRCLPSTSYTLLLYEQFGFHFSALSAFWQVENTLKAMVATCADVIATVNGPRLVVELDVAAACALQCSLRHAKAVTQHLPSTDWQTSASPANKSL